MHLDDHDIERIATRVVEMLRSAAPVDVYTSRTPPPGITRRAFNERCRRIAESGGDARLDGKVWVVPVKAYEAYLRGVRSPSKPAAPKLTKRSSTEAILAASGVHLKRTG